MFSLKQFHLLFIVLSIALAFGFAGWAFHDHRVGMAIGSALAGGALIVYLKKVYNKI